MRPRANIPIVKTLNSLSEKIMANVAPSDVYDDNGSGERDEFNELALRDLRGNTAEHRIMLNVKEQNRFFQKQDSAPSENARVFATQKPKEGLVQD
ncbi:RNA polymerase II transcription factor B subunit 1 [Metarhizium acridum]|nr:RNA polymerase II transcription factor B subunit 1 [Metarhizium acridum]